MNRFNLSDWALRHKSFIAFLMLAAAIATQNKRGNFVTSSKVKFCSSRGMSIQTGPCRPDVARAAIASYMKTYGDEGGARFNDLPTAAYVVDRSLFQAERHPVVVETTGTYTTGMTVVDWRRDLGLEANTDVLTRVDVPRLVEMLTERLSRASGR